MKKIALCSLLACMCAGGAYAGVVKGADCLREFSPANNNWFAHSNEYLFPTEEDYLKVVNRGTVYECDNNQCGNNTYVEMPAGHWFDGFERTTTVTYKCVLNIGNDKWVKVDSTKGLTKCTKSYEKWGATGADSDEYIYPTKADYDAVTKSEYGHVYECDSNVCKQGTEITLDSVHYFGKEKVTTPQRYVCVTKGGGDYWMKMDGLCNGGDCDKQCTYEGKKYNIGATIKNGVPCSEATDVDSKTGKTCLLTCMEQLANKGGAAINKWSVKECPDNATKVIKYSTPEQIYTAEIPGYKKCEFGKVPGKVPGKDPVQTSTNCTYTFRVTCTNGTEVTGLDGYPKVVNYDQKSLKSVQAKYGLFDDEIKQCVNNKTLDNSNTLYVKMWNVDNNEFANKLKTDAALNTQILNFCASHGGYNGEDNAEDNGGNANPVIYKQGDTVVGPDDEKIENAKKVLSAFTARAKSEASGWKTEDGKFNTMRLASDLSAGVVLGTVGGVVSGVVIKKKQVEKGFDALHCTVGGQTIADWGDTFSVGLQR